MSRLKRKRSSNIGMRAFFILLSREGKTVPVIAKQTGYTAQAVRVYIKSFKQKKLMAYSIKARQSRPALKSNTIKKVSIKLISRKPFLV